MNYAYSHASLLAKQVFFLAILIVLSACASTDLSQGIKSSEIQESENFVTEFPAVTIDQIASQVTQDTFKFGDTAKVNVYKVEELTRDYIVDRDGNINFPLIGYVKTAGLTTTELQNVLTESYGNGLLRSPSINVKLEAQTLGRIVVDGAVNEAGVFEVDKIIRLSEAIALAKGLNADNTNGSSIFIVRTLNGKRNVMEVDLRQIRQLGAIDPQIIPDDIVFVQDSAGRILFKEFLRTLPLLNTVSILATR